MKFIADEEGKLLDLLKLKNKDSSTSSLRSWIKEGRISVDGAIVKEASHLVHRGSEVALGYRKKYIAEGIEILFDDGELVVVDKPEGLLSVATDFDSSNTMHALLKNYYHPRKVHVVHRLDRETSGLLLFALSEKACEGLKKMFEGHLVDRRYLAVVEGHFEEKSGTWRSYLYEDANYFVRSCAEGGKGKLAITHYRVAGKSKKNTLLDISLETGKKNQIRVQSSDAGHPVIGDVKYGAESGNKGRLYLHAYSLSFVHPKTGRELSFSSPIPPSFFRLVKPARPLSKFRQENCDA